MYLKTVPNCKHSHAPKRPTINNVKSVKRPTFVKLYNCKPVETLVVLFILHLASIFRTCRCRKQCDIFVLYDWKLTTNIRLERKQQNYFKHATSKLIQKMRHVCVV